MNNTQVRLEVDGSRAAIVFSNENEINMVSSNLLHKLGAIVARLKRESHVRTTKVRAEGKVFMAGTDIHELSTFSSDQAREYATLGHDVMAELAAMPSITVAAIQGAAIGSGLEIALACDFRIAVRSAKLGLPEVSLGVVPAWGAVGRLTRLIGPSRAKKLFLSASPMSGEEALAWGLVDDVVNSPEDLLNRTNAVCESFYRASPRAAALAKRASRDLDDVGAFMECFEGRECREGIHSFLEKRPAKWME